MCTTKRPDMPERMTVTLTVNAQTRELVVDPGTSLIFVLRDEFALNGAKLGCGLEQCGACVVLVDGEPVYSCTKPIGDLEGKQVETVEGLAADDGRLHVIQESFLQLNAAQCGYCTAGLIMRTRALLADNPRPSRGEICAALDGHLCRCGAHPRIIKAVERASARLRERKR